MIKIDLFPSDHAALIELHQNHIHHVIRQRAHVILLRSERLSNDQISSLTALAESTIINYVHHYLLDVEVTH